MTTFSFYIHQSSHPTQNQNVSRNVLSLFAFSSSFSTFISLLLRCSGWSFLSWSPTVFFMFFVLSFLTHRLCCFQAFLCSLQFSLNCSQCYYIVVPAGLYFSPSDTMFELRHYEVFVCWHGGEVFWWIWRPGDPGCY